MISIKQKNVNIPQPSLPSFRKSEIVIQRAPRRIGQWKSARKRSQVAQIRKTLNRRNQKKFMKPAYIKSHNFNLPSITLQLFIYGSECIATDMIHYRTLHWSEIFRRRRVARELIRKNQTCRKQRYCFVRIFFLFTRLCNLHELESLFRANWSCKTRRALRKMRTLFENRFTAGGSDDILYIIQNHTHFLSQLKNKKKSNSLFFIYFFKM